MERYGIKTINFKRSFLSVLLGLILAVSIVTNTSAAYFQNDLIDDPIFLNAYSMSPQQIQSFLSGKGSYLANYTTVETEPYYPNYNKTVLAAQMIFDAGIVYGINPQVILATMQKEESLITDPSPSQSQLQFAMGYGCPDSSGCGSGSAGFAYQVDNGTWDLRFMFERARGNNTWWNSNLSYQCKNPSRYYNPGLFPGNNVTFYDDYGTAYTSFVVSNAATASLYCYTPHAYPGSSKQYFSGSYNFVNSFNQWFGSTLISFALVKATNSAAIYLLDGSSETVYLIPSYDVMRALNLASTPVSIIDPDALSGFTNGGTLSTLVRQANGAIYLAESGSRFSISNANQCTDWALSCFDSSIVKTLSDAVINNLANGGTLPPLQENSGTVYLMSDGKKNPILNSQELHARGYTWSNIVHMSNVNSTQSLGPLLLPNGTAVKYRSGNAIYLYDNNSYHLITDLNLINAWGLGANLAANPPLSSYDTTAPATSSPLSSIYASDGANTYLVDRGSKKNLSAVLNDWPVTTSVTFANGALANLPSSNATNVIRSESGGIYLMSGGAKRWIPTFDDFISLGYNSSSLTTVSNYTASSISNGQIKLAQGSLFRINNGAGIYYINDSESLLIPNPAYFGYYRLNSSKINNFGSDVLSAYPQSQILSALVVSSGKFYTPFNGQFLSLSTQNISDWGINTSGPTSLSSANFDRLSSSVAFAKFARTPDGTIYYGTGGASHKIQSYNTFIQLGGNGSNTTNVSSDFISLTTSGAPIN